jgi:hypothetical protein
LIPQKKGEGEIHVLRAFWRAEGYSKSLNVISKLFLLKINYIYVITIKQTMVLIRIRIIKRPLSVILDPKQ